MADERQFGTQELVSVRYLAQADESTQPEVEPPAPRAQPRRSGPENTIRWLTSLVVIMLVTAAGGLYWQNRASLASTAGELRSRRCVADWLLWASGSKKTFNEALGDRLKQAQRDSAFQFDQTKPAFETEFDNVDFQNLSQSWNGTR